MTTADEGGVRLWDANTFHETGRVTGSNALFSPNSQIIVTTADEGGVRLWDAYTFHETGRLDTASRVVGVSFSRDGQTITTEDTDVGTRLWDAKTLKQIGWLPSNAGPMSPDGRTYLSFRNGSSPSDQVFLRPTRPDDMLAQAARLIQRKPPELTKDELLRYGINQ